MSHSTEIPDLPRPADLFRTIGSDSDAKVIIRVMEKQCLDSTAALMLLGSDQLYHINYIGTSRRKLVLEHLEAHGLTTRPKIQSYAARALELFGSRENVPFQVLVLELTQVGHNWRLDSVGAPDVLGELNRTVPDMKLATLLDGASLEEILAVNGARAECLKPLWLELQGAVLNARLKYWHAHLS